jgi:2-polyprenyl-6-methoxyphenol hydroxylase-like FAD-dependent oxidoreductase
MNVERSMGNRNILISGASVAGSTLAYGLRRYGFNPTVVERAPAPRMGGQAIDLRGTARQVAERMGIMADIRQAHTGTHGMAFVDSAGKRVASMGAELFGDSGGPVAELEILRGDLVRILYTASRDQVEYIFDDSIASIAQGDDGVHVTFERGAPRIFDLLVGADGLHSNVRRQVFGAESEFVRDLGAYVSIFTTSTNVDLGGWELMYSMPGKNNVRGKTAALYPLPDRRAIAMFFFGSPAQDYDRHDVEQQKQLLAQAFAGEGWAIPQMLAALWQAPDFYFDRICQVQMDSWSRGRVALLGDAAHCGSPMAGNGSSMALVGAYVLAGELAAAAGDYRMAFASYESEMRDFVTRCQAFAQGSTGALLPKSRAQIWMRNLGLKTLPYMPWKSLIAGGFEKTVNAVTLKNYAC